MNTVTVRQMCLGDGVPKICVPVTASDYTELEKQLELVKNSPCDLVEWRVDFYNDTEGEWLERAFLLLRDSLKDIPLLFTFRTKEEGGEKAISIADYRELNLKAARSGFADLVDVELNRGEEFFAGLTSALKEAGVKVVGSYHDFAATPDVDQITGILKKMQTLGADVTKTAFMPQSDRDVMNLLEASLQMKEGLADRPFITMSMSRTGSISRLAGVLTGSAVTFATAGKSSAPGQMDGELVKSVLEKLS